MKKSNRARLCPVFFAMLACVGSAYAQERVVVTAGGHARAAEDQTVVHAGKCKNGAYEMRFSRDLNLAQLVLDRARDPVDLSATEFGTTVLTRPIAGRFAFACLENTVQISFYGFEVKAGNPPK